MDMHVQTFINSILEQDTKQELNTVVVASIVEHNHCGNGYFSWDGILDALAAIIGYDRASEILGEC
ncbi:hypothetical protein UFOVP247_69 [uncultured Caudovirales phage]|uniref:Uncharacterized protein n=1 Tax=uncultured Caudovirales phage TaxID=2100421 RepID=A0A6J7WSR9_9CAUD|nr:hypothetical protein UFOVP247_69 [uncultured Caudovirales phage]